MKHKYLYIFPALALLFGFTACSSEDDITDGGQQTEVTGDDVIVKAGIGANSVFTRSNPIGKAQEQAQFKPGDVIYVSDGTQEAFYKLADDGKTWEYYKSEYYSSGYSPLKWDTNEKTFYAHYPVYEFDATGHETTMNNFYNLAYSWNIPRSQNLSDYGGHSSALTLSDVMFAKADETKKSDHTLNLTFERQTARMILKFSFDTDQFKDLHPSIAKVTVWGTRYLETNNSQYVPSISEIFPYYNTPNDEYVALSFPHEAKNTEKFLEISVKHDKDAYGSTSDNLTLTGVPALEKGKSYTFNVTVGKEKMSIESVTVSGWTDKGSIGEGEATQQ